MRNTRKIFSLFLAGILLLLSLFSAACAVPGRAEGNGQGASSAQGGAGQENGGRQGASSAQGGAGQEGGKQGASSAMENDAGQQPETAMGRYRETPIPLPSSVSAIFGTEQKDGILRVLAEQEPGTLCCFRSEDGGAAWEEEPWNLSWLPEGFRAVAACFAPDGAVYVSAGKMSDDPMDEQHATGAFTYFRLEETEGNLQASTLSLGLPEPKEESLKGGYGLTSMACGEDGSLYGMLSCQQGEGNSFEAVGLDPGSGSLRWKREISRGEIQVYGTALCLNEYDGKLQILDGASGKTLSETESPSGSIHFRLMDMDAEGKRFFYCNESGIYSTDTAMALTELLVDGRLSRFSDTSTDVKYFCAVDEKVFLLFSETNSSGSLELLRYEYDAGLATQPEQELRIYSLNGDDIIKKLVSDFRASRPDVLITYETGMEGASAKSGSDAISILNTEIMAGNGPDLLFLNGLPWESYAKQGILADISSLKACQDGAVFENLFAAYGTEGGQYAVPIAFSIPVLAGEESQIAKAGSLEELVELAKSTEGLPPLSAYNFLPYLFSIFWEEIQGTEENISKERLKDFFVQAKELDGLAGAAETDFNFMQPFQKADSGQAVSYACFTPFLDIWNVVYGNVASSVGYLGNIHDFASILCQMPGRRLSYRPFPEHVFAALAAGINSKSGKVSLAQEFLEFALGKEEQRVLADGSLPAYSQFPVNKEVWESMEAEPSEEELLQYGKIFQQLGGEFQWPGKEAFEGLEQAVEGLTTPVLEDSAIMRTVLDAGSGYLSGGKSLDGAVNEVLQMLELYLAE